jgi:hypothetical protein
MIPTTSNTLSERMLYFGDPVARNPTAPRSSTSTPASPCPYRLGLGFRLGEIPSAVLRLIGGRRLTVLILKPGWISGPNNIFPKSLHPVPTVKPENTSAGDKVDFSRGIPGSTYKTKAIEAILPWLMRHRFAKEVQALVTEDS